MNGSGSRKRASGISLAVVAIGLGAALTLGSTAYAEKTRVDPGPSVEDMRRELAQKKLSLRELIAELYRVTAEMRPLEREIDVLVEELQHATDKASYYAILAELEEVASEWSALKYEQVNLVQNIQFLLTGIHELEDAIEEIESASSDSNR